MVSIRIPLTQNKFARVSIEDAERVRAYKWYAHNPSGGKGYYACRKIRVNGKKVTITMHAMIAGKGYDHANRDSLDNRRSNLRPATASQQMMNRGLHSNNTSGHRGVREEKRWPGKWTARIQRDHKVVHLGTFGTFEQAVAARQAAEREMFGEYRAM